MAYTPYEWTVNSYLNPTRMNAIEQGIAAASQAAESAAGDFSTIEEYIGTQSIAGIGDGTIAGAIWKTNSDLTVLSETVTTLNSKTTQMESNLSAISGNKFENRMAIYKRIYVNANQTIDTGFSGATDTYLVKIGGWNATAVYIVFGNNTSIKAVPIANNGNATVEFLLSNGHLAIKNTGSYNVAGYIFPLSGSILD